MVVSHLNEFDSRSCQANDCHSILKNTLVLLDRHRCNQLYCRSRAFHPLNIGCWSVDHYSVESFGQVGLQLVKGNVNSQINTG